MYGIMGITGQVGDAVAEALLLGFTAFAVDGGEIMSYVQIAMIAGLPYTAVRDAILTHPTLADRLGALFSSPPTKIDLRREPQSATRATGEVATEAKLLAKAVGLDNN